MSASVVPVIAGVSIRVSEDGYLFNLNDLHQASGGQKRHQVSDWFKTEKAQQYIACEEKREGKPVVRIVRGGAAPGTYVSKMVAYDYAAWISPEFKGQVYRIVDAVFDGDHALADTEARKAVALWEQAKKDGFPAVDADWMIARALGKQDEFEQAQRMAAEREAKAKELWAQNTVEGFVATQLANVWKGNSKTLTIPDHFNMAAVQVEIECFMLKREACCRFTPMAERIVLLETA